MKIAEVSKKYGLSLDTLRYYERIGLIQTVPRNQSGIREYGDSDIQRVEFIKCMRNAGLPIEVLIEYVALVQQGEETVEARKQILEEQREILISKIDELQQTLALLNHKIEIYENKVLVKEKTII